MDPRKSRPFFALAIVLCLLAPTVARAATDVITVGTVSASGGTVDVPIYIRDVAGTPLGVDQAAGSKIQAFSIKVSYAPSAAIQSVTISRAGITANLSPAFETKPAGSGTISLVEQFDESTNPIPFSSNASSPGNLVAHMVFTLSASATPGSSIALTLDSSSLTQLGNAGGTTNETVANGGLSLVNGAINIPQLSLSIVPGSRNVPVGGTGQLAVLLNISPTSPVTVNLSSSNANIAKVSSSVTVPAGTNSADFNVTGVAVGNATITASSGTTSATASVTVIEAPAQCTAPTAPTLNASASVNAGTPYNVTWAAVANATEYLLDESTDSTFVTNTTTQTLTTTSATFTHAGGNVRYYYRVRAHNAAGTCNLFSDFSTAISVLITPAPVAAKRVLAVVGSLQGGFGSFFKTSVQLYNPKDVTISGKIVFHPANAPGSASDPSLVYSLAPGKTQSYADLLPAMNVASGIGSADVVADLGSALPVSLVRVYNDAGPLGTTGLAEEQLDEENALQSGATAALIAPADVQKFRLSIGIRTLGSGAAMTINVRDKEGTIVKTLTKSYEPTFFTQPTSAALLDGYALTGGETISFTITSGSAFIYGSTTDNITNDPSVQMAQKI